MGRAIKMKREDKIEFLSEDGDMKIFRPLFLPDSYFMTIESICILKSLCHVNKGIEYAKDTAFEFLEEKIETIENLKRQLTK
jgi:hypothetical protein